MGNYLVSEELFTVEEVANNVTNDSASGVVDANYGDTLLHTSESETPEQRIARIHRAINRILYFQTTKSKLSVCVYGRVK